MVMAQQALEYLEPELLRAVFGNFHIAQNLRSYSRKSIRFFHLPDDCQYLPYCDDFGPMNLASVFRFNRALREELETCSDSTQKVVFALDKGRRELSNAIFLIGAYMILENDSSVEDVLHAFSWLHRGQVEGFRDATYVPADFELSLADCWRGLAEGRRLKWIGSVKAIGSVRVDIRLYEHFDNPLNGDLHVVVPGKIAAFAGPVDLAGQQYQDDPNGLRFFSPKYYANIFKQMGVTDVIQLNFSEYDTVPFQAKGVTHHKLAFPDCTCPTDDIVDAFLRIVDGARGLVAVHCRAGLGRTGTLIARYLMRSHGFGARQVIAWLRIMRPGSVIGPQQHYLCSVEALASPTSDSSVLKRLKPPLDASQRPSVRLLKTAGPALAPSRDASDGSGPSTPGTASAPRASPQARTPGSGASSRPRGPLPPLARSQPAPATPATASPSACQWDVDNIPASARPFLPSPGAPLASQVRQGMATRGAARVLAQLTRKPLAAPAASAGGGGGVARPWLQKSGSGTFDSESGGDGGASAGGDLGRLARSLSL